MSKVSQVARSSGAAVIRRASSFAATRPQAVPAPIHGAGTYELIETDMGPLWMLTRDEVMRPYLMRRETWEQSTGNVLRRLLRPGARFLDIGANVGYFSLFVHRLALDIQIDAVEPHPELFNLLQANLWANEVKAIIHNAALGEKRRLLPMESPEMNPGDSRVGIKTADQRYDLIVPVLTGDELLAGRTFDVAKVTVQGFESEVVLGMERIVRESPAIVLVVDFWPSAIEDRGLEPLEVLDRYRQMGFHIAVNDDGGTGTCTADTVLDHCRSAGPNGQVKLILQRNA
jgi:FkbM family methyltransferase